MTDGLDLVLRRAHLVTAQAEHNVDIGVRHGRIAWLGPADECDLDADDELELDRHLLLPGLIDAHVHFREPGEHSHKASYASESRAAAAGGVTCVLTMPNTVPFTGTREVLEQARWCAQRSLVDYGFHFGVAADNLDELRAVRNVASFKLYLNETMGITSPLCDRRLLARVFELGHPVTVHAEGETLEFALEVHAEFGSGPLYVVHVALADEVAALRRAKASGQWVYGEATPHHLFLTAADAKELGPRGDMRPTLKSPEDVDALWQGLADGTIDTIATDHAPHLLLEKQQEPPPPGVPGLQTLLPLLLSAVRGGKLCLRDVVRLTSQRPAAIFGLCGKGGVRVGADADFVLVDADQTGEFDNTSQLTRPGWTPFAGLSYCGAVVMTLRRGRVVYRDGRILGEGGGMEVHTGDPGAWTEPHAADRREVE